MGFNRLIILSKSILNYYDDAKVTLDFIIRNIYGKVNDLEERLSVGDIS